MARTFYSDYITHCLRFYARYSNPVFRSDADQKNWEACDKVLKNYPSFVKEVLMYVYKEGDTIADNVYQVSKAKNIEADSVWKFITDLERKVAVTRGLL